MQTNTWAFVPAGGHGQRMGATKPKQYLPIGDRPMLRHTVERLHGHPGVAGVVVGVALNDPHFAELGDLPVKAVTVAGPDRAQTVFNGLDAMIAFAGDGDRVLVHDAVRPLVRAADIDRLLERVGSDDNGGLLAMPLVDTVKRSDELDRVAQTPDRAHLWRAATPQLFPLRLLHEALRRALAEGLAVTDEAAAMEHAGHRPLLVPCAMDNIKVTTPEDLELAAWLWQRQAEGR